MHHEQDIFRMGGLRRRLPGVFRPFLAGALCLAGVPLTGGFFSKDSILIATWAKGGMLFGMLYIVALLTVFLTAIYTFRMLFIVFGEREDAMQQPRQDRPHSQVKQLPRIMEIILIPLALLSLAGGLFNLPANLSSGLLDSFLAPLSEEGKHLSHAVEFILQGVASLVSLAGIGVAWFYYGRKRRERLIARAEHQPDRQPGMITFLQAGWYFDELYHFLFIRPFKWLSTFLWERVDEGVIDDSLDWMALTFGRTGQFLGKWGRGRVSVYMLSLVCGATLMIVWFAWEVL
jgi:NADH-quinone oxidoreductase subunit L